MKPPLYWGQCCVQHPPPPQHTRFHSVAFSSILKAQFGCNVNEASTGERWWWSYHFNSWLDCIKFRILFSGTITISFLHFLNLKRSIQTDATFDFANIKKKLCKATYWSSISSSAGLCSSLYPHLLSARTILLKKSKIFSGRLKLRWKVIY